MHAPWPTDTIGTVYGVVLNDAASVDRRAAAFHEPPYRSPPVAPVLYIKPRNTFAPDGAAIAVPVDPGAVRIGATIGAVIGRVATRVTAADALSFVAGYVIVADLALPHASLHRPAIRQRCRDGFCPIGPVTVASGFDVASASIATSIDGIEVHRWSPNRMVRSLPRLIADVTAFMTLAAGDIVLVGAPDDVPLACIGSTVTISVEGLGALTHTLVAEATP